MYETINEQVAVLVTFHTDTQKVRPLKMRWKNRAYVFNEVNYHFKYKRGTSLIHVFSVNDGANYFELEYDSEGLIWMLGRVSDGQAA